MQKYTLNYTHSNSMQRTDIKNKTFSNVLAVLVSFFMVTSVWADSTTKPVEKAVTEVVKVSSQATDLSETVDSVNNITKIKDEKPNVEVGKRLNAETDVLSMIFSLMVVLSIIVLSAWVLKRFQKGTSKTSGLSIVSSLHLGSKEKIVVIKAGEQQWLLGVTSQQINLLDRLPTTDAYSESSEQGKGDSSLNNTVTNSDSPLPFSLSKLLQK